MDELSQPKMVVNLSDNMLPFFLMLKATKQPESLQKQRQCKLESEPAEVCSDAAQLHQARVIASVYGSKA